MTNILSITGRGQITIPAKIREKLELNKGSQMLLSYTNNTLIIKPLPQKENVLDLYASISTKNKNSNPIKAIEQAKKLKAKQTAKQKYQ